MPLKRAMPLSTQRYAVAGDTVTPIALTEYQLEQIKLTTSALPLEQRDAFLQTVAGLIQSRPGDGEVYRACTAAAKAVRYDSMQCEAI
jgi:hypothetical protein